MASSLRKPVVVGVIAGALTAVAVFGGTGAFLAAAQDSPDTTAQARTPPRHRTRPRAPTHQAPSGQATPAPDQQDQIDAWRQCMADHGVTLPTPSSDEGRPDRPGHMQMDESQRQAFQAAIDACGPPPGRGAFGPGGHPGGHNCPGMGQAPGTTPDQSTPNDTAPSVGGLVVPRSDRTIRTAPYDPDATRRGRPGSRRWPT